MTDTPEAAQAAEAPSLDEALSAKFQEMNTEPKEEDATPKAKDDGEAVSEQPVEEPAEKVEGEQADEKPAIELPTDLPVDFKDDWASLPEKTREAITKTHRELSHKLGEQGTEIKALAPIKDVLTDAIQTMPFLRDMHPATAASQIMETAKIAQRFNDDPVTATLQVIQRYGVADQIAQVLGGQAPQQHSMTPQEVAQITQQQLEYRDTAGSVTDFSSKAEHWGEVAEDLPDYIGLLKRKDPTAAPADILSKAYEMAIRANGLEKAPSEAASPEAVVNVDSEQVEAAAKAKSVNVASKPTGSPRKLTEDEILRKTFRRMQAS